LIFGTSEGRFIALNGNSGSEIFNLDLAALYGKAFDIDHAPVIADFDKDGVLDAFIIGGHGEYPNFENDYGRGYAISLGTGKGPDWLMFQHDIHRSSSLCNDELTSTESFSYKDQNEFFAYPNPFSNEVSFIADSPGLIIISDLSGRKLKEIIIDGASIHNAIYWYGTDACGNNLAPGVYFAFFKGNNSEIALKLVAR
jgi:hypothetical protein